MKLLRTWFLAASARSSASAAASLTGSGNSIASRRAMARGTMLSRRPRRGGSVVGIDADMGGQELGGVLQCTERYRMLRSRWHRHGAVSKKGSQAQAVLA